MKNAIFFCNFPPPYTGQTIGTKLTYDLLADQFEIACMNTSDDVISTKQSALFFLKRTWRIKTKTDELVQVLQEKKYDTLYLVLSSNLSGHLRDLYVIKRAAKYVNRIIVHIRSGNFHENFERPWHQFLTRPILSRINHFIFLSKDLSERSAPYIDDARREIIYNPIDEGVRIAPAEFEHKIAALPNEKTFRIVYISNMIPSKGYLDLAMALSILKKQSSHPFHAQFVGAWLSKKDREDFEQKIEALGIAAHITIAGTISERAVIKQLYLDAHVFVLPTYYPIEAQPRSIIEAMNAGTPIIATRHASIPEYVANDREGYLVDIKSPEQIASAISLLMEKDNWLKKATNARRAYNQLFSHEYIQERLLKLFA